MLLTTKGKYGLRAVFAVALNGNEPLSLSAIARQEGLSESYLEILMAALKKGGILVSTRGARGGYRLAADPSELTVGRILRVLEGSTAAAECVAEGETVSSCGNEGTCNGACRIHGVLMKINQQINAVLDSMTLQDMLDDELKTI